MPSTAAATDDSEVTSQGKAAAWPAGGGDGGHRGVEVVAGHVQAGHGRALPGQALGHRPADARAGPGDDGDLSPEALGVL